MENFWFHVSQVQDKALKLQAKTQAAKRRSIAKRFRTKKQTKNLTGVDNPAVELEEKKDQPIPVGEDHTDLVL